MSIGKIRRYLFHLIYKARRTSPIAFTLAVILTVTSKMAKFFLSILLTTVFSACASQDNQTYNDTLSNLQESNMDLDMDFIDVYKLTIGTTPLYENFDSFINDIGLPSNVTISKIDHEVKSKTDLDKVIATTKDPTSIVTLHYPGIEMWFSHDNYIIPATIDFRKTNKSITYGQTTFDKTYSIEQFKNQFSKSANPSFNLPQSLFEITTKEKGSNFEHYMLVRKSKDDPSATPMVEFTFDKGKLVFILFANF